MLRARFDADLIAFFTRCCEKSQPKRRQAGALQSQEGQGRWQLSNDGETTTVRYDWSVETTKAWMNYLAPIARPVFKWNHDVVMGWGREGLAKKLGLKNSDASG